MKRIAQRPKLLTKGKIKNKSRSLPKKSSNNSGFYRKIESLNGRAKVCVIRSLGGIGDVLMTTPGLRELKRRFPKIHLTYAIDMHSTKNNNYYELVKNLPYIDSIVDARYIDRTQYDAIKDISAVCVAYERFDLPSINRIDLFAKNLGIHKLMNTLPDYRIITEELRWANNFINRSKDNDDQMILALHTASFDAKRTWPASNYHSLIKMLESLNIKILLFDFNNKLKQKNTYSNIVNCSGTDIRQMSALISMADLFVGPDSGPMHIAGAVGTKSLVLFGSVPPEARINHYPTHRAIVNESMSCLGCWYAACKYNVECMSGLQPSLVFDKIKDSLGVSDE